MEDLRGAEGIEREAIGLRNSLRRRWSGSAARGVRKGGGAEGESGRLITSASNTPEEIRSSPYILGDLCPLMILHFSTLFALSVPVSSLFRH